MKARWLVMGCALAAVSAASEAETTCQAGTPPSSSPCSVDNKMLICIIKVDGILVSPRELVVDLDPNYTEAHIIWAVKAGSVGFEKNAITKLSKVFTDLKAVGDKYGNAASPTSPPIFFHAKMTLQPDVYAEYRYAIKYKDDKNQAVSCDPTIVNSGRQPDPWSSWGPN